jgi:hypothetical protein
MARAERIVTDEGIQAELDVYRGLLPDDGELAATAFVELTSEEDLRHWLPKLVGIEASLGIDLDGGSVTSAPEAAHGQALSRETVTSAVHYVRFRFAPDQVERLARGPASLVARHPEYEASTPLSEETRQELVADLAGGSPLQPLG